jgi:hypothetical protein
MALSIVFGALMTGIAYASLNGIPSESIEVFSTMYQGRE